MDANVLPDSAGYEYCYDCVFKNIDICMALSNTFFENEICPFRKTKAELNESRAKAEKRLKEMGNKECQKLNYFTAYVKVPSLNEYTAKERSNAHAGAKFKRRVEDDICQYIFVAMNAGTLRPCTAPVDIYIRFHEKTTKRDVDNIQFSTKFILDAMQTMGILENDSRRCVRQIYHKIIEDSEDKFDVILSEEELTITLKKEGQENEQEEEK